MECSNALYEVSGTNTRTAGMVAHHSKAYDMWLLC